MNFSSISYAYLMVCPGDRDNKIDTSRHTHSDMVLVIIMYIVIEHVLTCVS